MTEDDRAEVGIVVDEILDGPGDCYYPFSDLRLYRLSDELRVSRALQDAVARAAENTKLKGDAYAHQGFALCLWAIQELETELVALKRERSSGQR
jgi:hypothetical protein